MYIEVRAVINTTRIRIGFSLLSLLYYDVGREDDVLNAPHLL